MMQFESKILQKRFLSRDTFVLRLERHHMKFRAGQYVVIDLNGDSREYSLYSGEEDPFIEVLIRRIENGNISQKLSQLEVGEMVKIEGPYGFFVINPEDISEKKLVFLATGTGIAPFRSYVRSLNGLDYFLLHGTRNISEAYEHESYERDRLIFCTSRENGSDYKGRVTEYFRKYMKTDNHTIYYLCGNSEMIEEMAGYLEEHDIDPFFIRSEEFF